MCKLWCNIGKPPPGTNWQDYPEKVAFFKLRFSVTWILPGMDALQQSGCVRIGLLSIS